MIKNSKQIVLKIYGRVQMVMFRDSTQRQAKKLKLVGWVINEPDKTVKIVAEGKEKNLKGKNPNPVLPGPRGGLDVDMGRHSSPW